MFYSDPEYQKKLAEVKQCQLAIFPLPIPFVAETSMFSHGNKPDEDQKEMIEFPLDPNKKDINLVKCSVTIFEDGTTKEWIRWQIKFDALLHDIPSL